MSYDLYFLEAEVCGDHDAIHEHLESGRAPRTPESEARKRRLAQELRRQDSTLEIFQFDYQSIAEFEGTTVEQARQTHDHIELNGPEDGPGIQIMIFSDHASITVPYWHEGSKAESVFSQIERFAKVLVGHGGFRIFDPQLDRVVDDLAEVRVEILESYAGVTQRLPEIIANVGERKKPWWQFW